MNINNSILQLIGNTPMLELKNYAKMHSLTAKIFAKLECLNPFGSVKDRVALAMINAAQKSQKIDKDTVIIEPTSGNTGIALAAVCATKGLQCILTMPDTMSVERRNLLSSYGAKLVLTDGKKGIQGAVDEANRLHKSIKNSFIPDQFSNPANPLAHKSGTAVEIYNDMDKKIDYFVAGIGSGGTISGVGEYLKEKNNNISIIGVEPSSSPLITNGYAAPHKIQGIGANFIPKNLNMQVVDKIITITDQDAITATKQVAQTDGVFVGISAGAALYAAQIIAEQPQANGKNIVVIFPDKGDRYLSTNLFN